MTSIKKITKLKSNALLMQHLPDTGEFQQRMYRDCPDRGLLHNPNLLFYGQAGGKHNFKMRGTVNHAIHGIEDDRGYMHVRKEINSPSHQSPAELCFLALGLCELSYFHGGIGYQSLCL